jgi:hypothetical protein
MRKFNEEEMRELIRTAQLFAPQFTEGEYQRLMQMQQEMAESGFLEAAWGVHEVQQKYGITLSEAAARHAQLVRDIQEEEAKLNRLREESSQTTLSLQQAKAEGQRLETELELITRQTEGQKRRLRAELEQAMEENRVSHQDIALAARLKSELEGNGLGLKLALELMRGFTSQPEPAMKLATAVAEYGSELQAREALRRENEALRKEHDHLRAEEKNRQQALAQLEAQLQRDQDTLCQLRSDLAEEDNLRRFHWRFQKVARFLEYLATWGHLFPLRCHNLFCGARFWVSRGPAHLRTGFLCPCCGAGLVDYDEDALAFLGLREKAPIEIKLEEVKHGQKAAH